MQRTFVALALAAFATQASGAQTLTPFENPSPPPATPKRVVHHAVAKKPVPVIAPRHTPAVRHPLRPTSAKPTLPKQPLSRQGASKPVAKAEPPAPAKPAPPPVPADVGTNTGLHLPRFAALKSDDVNMRTGPGERYPVIWEYQRRDLPVRIEREFDVWRLVEDMDGVKGWVHQATLTGRREFVITGTADVDLRSQPNETSEAVAVLKPGVIGHIKACAAADAWCQVEVQSYRGFLKRTDLWGLLEGEAITP
jgi:SH3-like domain-containing protein